MLIAAVSGGVLGAFRLGSSSTMMIFMAGASALMVGNYLTTLNQPVEKDLQMLKDLGLDPCWDKHGFSDQAEPEEHRSTAFRLQECPV